MTGRDVVKTAFDLKESARIPTTLIAGGSRAVHMAGETFAALKDIVSRIKSKGKYAMVHICGDTTRILEDIVDIGPDCFSLDSKVDLRKAKEVLGGRVCVAGNVSPTDAFLSGTPEEVIREGKACVEAWGEGGGYVLALGCDFPKNAPYENIQALMSLKEN